MSIQIRTEIKVYCDGGVHQGLEFVTGSNDPAAAAREFVRSAGWSSSPKGIFCPEHKPGGVR